MASVFAYVVLPYIPWKYKSQNPTQQKLSFVSRLITEITKTELDEMSEGPVYSLWCVSQGLPVEEEIYSDGMPDITIFFGNCVAWLIKL